MREIFERLEQFHARRPEAKKSNIWYVEKIRHEEAHELLEVTYNEPQTAQEALPMLKEGADIILCVLELYMSVGISPELTTQIILSKIDEIEERPAERFSRPIGANGTHPSQERPLA